MIDELISEYGALVEYSDRGKPKSLERNLSQCHSVHHISYLEWSGIENRPSQRETSNKLPEPWHCCW